MTFDRSKRQHMSLPSSSSPPAPVLPLPRRTITKRATNLSLSPELVTDAARVAAERYHTTLSGLAERLLSQAVLRDARSKRRQRGRITA